MPYSKIMLVAVLVGVVLFAGSPAGAQENEEAITALAWSSDGTHVAVGRLGGQIEVISADGQSHQVLQKASGRRVNELAWHPDGNLLASGSDHGNVQIWDTTVGSYTEFSAEYPLDCVGLLWSYDGSRLLAISSQREPNLFIWQAETGELISSASVGSLYDPHWNRDNTFLIAGNASTVLALISTGDRIIGTPIGEPTFPTVIGEQMFTADWSPDETRVAGGTPSGRVRVWDVNTKQLVMDVGGENYDVSTWQLSLIVELVFTLDGQQIQALDGSGVFRVWDVTSAELLIDEQLPVTGTPIYAAAFSPDETAIAYGGEDGELSITAVPGTTKDHDQTNDIDSTQTDVSPPSLGHTDDNILPADLLFTTLTAGSDYWLSNIMRVDAQTLQISLFYMDGSSGLRPLAWSPKGDLLAILRSATPDSDHLELCLLTREGVLQSCFEDKIVGFAFRERGQDYMVTWSEDERYLYFVTDYEQYHRIYDVIESWGSSLVEADVATGQTLRTLYQAEVANQLPAVIYWTTDLHYVESLLPGEAPKTVDLWQNTEFTLPQDITDMGHLKFCHQFSPQGQYLTGQTYQNDALSGWALLTPEGKIAQTIGNNRLQQAGIAWMDCPVWQSDEAAFYFLGGPQEDRANLFKYVLADDTLVNVKQLYPPDPPDPVFMNLFPEMPLRLAPDNATLAISFRGVGSVPSQIHILTPTSEWITYGGEETPASAGAGPIWFPVVGSD